ncbi:hypothetical protein OBBRIDRAFT_319344 [Obba rivulosa]|uniref:Uncharacterized protein n=1 Tax=Obba rivulosa TaxID=1052685 RepID=A0A8E2J2Q3_9APHY|nr:hypothetical protein OBBRIDRAFT_319344 [Obba rivulosa]
MCGVYVSKSASAQSCLIPIGKPKHCAKYAIQVISLPDINPLYPLFSLIPEQPEWRSLSFSPFSPPSDFPSSCILSIHIHRSDHPVEVVPRSPPALKDMPERVWTSGPATTSARQNGVDSSRLPSYRAGHLARYHPYPNFRPCRLFGDNPSLIGSYQSNAHASEDDTIEEEGVTDRIAGLELLVRAQL